MENTGKMLARRGSLKSLKAIMFRNKNKRNPRNIDVRMPSKMEKFIVPFNFSLSSEDSYMGMNRTSPELIPNTVKIIRVLITVRAS